MRSEVEQRRAGPGVGDHPGVASALRPCTGEEGQAGVEFVALVGIIAGVLVAAAAACAVWSPTIRNAVTTAVQRSLCVVAGQRCELLRREPCPVLRTTQASRQGVALGLLRLGHDRSLVIERRSDGTYVMSLVEGLKAGEGVAESGSELAAFSAEASLMMGGRAGRTYVAASPAEARALAERLRSQHLPGLRAVAAGVTDLAGLSRADPSVSSYVLAGEVAADAMVKFGIDGVLGAGAELGAQGELGVQAAAHAREVTVYAKADGRVGAFFSALDSLSAGGRPRSGSRGGGPSPAGSAGAGGARPAAGDPRVTVRSPLATELAAEAMAGGSVSLRFAPGPRLIGIEIVGRATVRGTDHEVRARVDPTDPGVREALGAYLRAPTDPATFAALGRAAADGAVLDQRTFERTGSDEHERALEVAAVASIGFSASSGVVTGRLTEQRTRPLGGVWEERIDCLE